MAEIIEEGRKKTTRCHSCTSLIGFTVSDVRYEYKPPVGFDDEGRDSYYIVCPGCGAHIAVSNYVSPQMKKAAKERERYGDDSY